MINKVCICIVIWLSVSIFRRYEKLWLLATCSRSEELLNLIVGLDSLAFNDNLMEVVLFKLVDLNILAQKALMQESLVFSEVSLWERDVVQLLDVAHVVDCEALFELIWELLDVFLVAQRQDDSRDIVVLAGCQFFTDSTDADDLSKSRDLTSHSQVSRCWPVNSTRHKSRKQ